MKSIVYILSFVSLLSSGFAQNYSSSDEALILEVLNPKRPLPTTESKPPRAVKASELIGEWYIISSNSIPFVDGSVTFTTDGKMITTWQHKNRSDDIIHNKYTFIRAGLIEYPNPSSSEKYQIKASIEKGWLILHWTDGRLHFVLSRHPRN